MEYVPNAPFRALAERAVEQGTVASMAALAYGVGMVRPAKNQGDTTGIKRALGIMTNGHRVNRYIPYDLAVKIVRFCGELPVDYGV